ncbi:uncharacterized protein PSFLO_03000 [Pseudozyma flocculosa]|uniref:Uncharacterized protein n=1 Tax=Pseudozyma flocculosa TaxID=84751 RepID=A0A5C3F0B6_9BASI|nr:uncharacterized protein PSFLO_03000 [Pseudozyma flocculosa]
MAASGQGNINVHANGRATVKVKDKYVRYYQNKAATRGRAVITPINNYRIKRDKNGNKEITAHVLINPNDYMALNGINIYVDKKGYAPHHKGGNHSLHQWLIGKQPGKFIHHKDANKLNNTCVNLVHVTQQNAKVHVEEFDKVGQVLWQNEECLIVALELAPLLPSCLALLI